MIECGKTIIFTSGEYSDYHIIGLFHVVQDFDIEAERLKFVAGKEKYYQDENKFIRQLVDGGFIQEIPCGEINVGAYSIMEADLSIEEVGAGGECSYCHVPLKSWDARQRHRDLSFAPWQGRTLCKLCAIPDVEPVE